MKTIKKVAAVVALSASAVSLNANAHVVGIGWDALGNGDVTFYGMHWHGNIGAPSGSLSLGGNSYGWTGFLNNMAQGSLGLDGFEPGSATNNYDDWLTVTISGLSDGAYNAYTTGGNAINSWAGPRGGVSLNIDVVEQQTSDVSEPSTLALLALGLVGVGVARRKAKS